MWNVGGIAPDDPGGEDHLFLSAVEGARPLRNRDRRHPTRELGGPRPPLTGRHQERFSLDPDGSGRAPGVSRKVVRRLRQGQPGTTADLDLHGLRFDRAEERLGRFLSEARAEGCRAVRIITGKAVRQVDPDARLQKAVPTWLTGPLSHHVLAFCQARPEHGGSGALYLLLRSS